MKFWNITSGKIRQSTNEKRQQQKSEEKKKGEKDYKLPLIPTAGCTPSQYHRKKVHARVREEAKRHQSEKIKSERWSGAGERDGGEMAER